MTLSYINLQIIKHALTYYIQRPNAIKQDVEREKRLLDKVTNEVDRLKIKLGING